jgi:hypothetical protein
MRQSLRFLFLALLLIASLIQAPSAQAGTITATGSGVAFARSSLGQSFTMPANTSGTLSSIFVAGIRGRANLNVVCVQAKIYTSSAKTTLLETSSNNVCDTDASGTETTGLAPTDSFTFANTTSLAAGTQYFFELTRVSGEAAFWTTQSYISGSGGSYSGGQLFADGNFKADYDMVFTLTYTDVVPVSNVNKPTVSGAILKGISKTITATADTPGWITFFINGKVIPRCRLIATTGSAPSVTATCSFKPAVHGTHRIRATLKPSTNATPSTSESLLISVARRTTTR